MKQRKRTDNKYIVYQATRSMEYECSKQNQLTPEKYKEEDFTKEQWVNETINQLRNTFKEKIELYEYLIAIVHDKDKKKVPKRDENNNIEKTDTGEIVEEEVIKPIHIHILVRFKNNRSFMEVKNEINPYNDRERNFEFTKYEGGQARYLTHISEKARQDGKYIYPISDLIIFKKIKEDETSDDDNAQWIFKELQGEEKNIFYNELTSIDFESVKSAKVMRENFYNKLLKQIQTGKIEPHQAQETFLEQFDSSADYNWLTSKKIKEWENKRQIYLKNIKTLNRKALFYIQGFGGVGKSLLAVKLSEYFAIKDKKAIKPYCPSGGAGNQINTIFGEYNGEHSVVLEDLDTSSKTNRSWFTTTFEKNKRASYQLNRISNVKVIANYYFLTNSITLEQFVREVTKTPDLNNPQIAAGYSVETTHRYRDLQVQCFRRPAVTMEIKSKRDVLKLKNGKVFDYSNRIVSLYSAKTNPYTLQTTMEKLDVEFEIKFKDLIAEEGKISKSIKNLADYILNIYDSEFKVENINELEDYIKKNDDKNQNDDFLLNLDDDDLFEDDDDDLFED